MPGRTRTITTEQASGNFIKGCMDCKQSLPLAEFGVNGILHSSGKQKYKPRCHKCEGVKERAVFYSKVFEIVGGRENYKCQLCGYDRYVGALEFHHTDPNTKDREIGRMQNYSKERLKTEIDKCMILCAICHREEHYRLSGGDL